MPRSTFSYLKKELTNKKIEDILSSIESQIVSSRFSEVGYDPFGLITQYGVKPVINDINEVIEKYDLTQLENGEKQISPVSAPINPKLVPKIIHLHWVGKDLVAEDRWKLLKN